MDLLDEIAILIMNHYIDLRVITKGATNLAGLDIGLGVSNFKNVVFSAGFTF